MIYIFIGPSASGKDTQIKYAQKYIQLPNISTGQAFRDEIASGSELGIKAKKNIEAGLWPSDDLVFEVLQVALSKNPETKKGFILNGYPRTYPQVPMLDKLVENINEKIVKVVHFDLDKETALKRFETQIKDAPNRPDNTREAFLSRLNEYSTNIKPILEEYEKRGILIRVNAAGTKEEVFKEMMEKLEITPDGTEKF